MAYFEFKDTWWKKDVHMTSIKITVVKGDDEEIAFDVNLGSIRVSDPSDGMLSRKNGREVIIYWDVLEMNNHAMFYTDSNSLGFVSRMSKQTDNIGKRFFPVTSAIINGDNMSNKWLAVMTDRSFGGSIQKGRTEILLNRRLTQHDNGGIDEKLDEPGPNKNGYNLQARFILQTANSLGEAIEFAQKKSVFMRRPVTISLVNSKPLKYSSEILNSWLYYRTFEERRVDLIAALEFNRVLDLVVIPMRASEDELYTVKLNVRLHLD